MSKRKGVLEEYISQRNSLNVQGNEISQKLLDIMQYYYDIYDMEHNTVHGQIFRILYLERSKVTYEDIAEKSFVDIRTLNRYIKKYNDLALKLLDKI